MMTLISPIELWLPGNISSSDGITAEITFKNIQQGENIYFICCLINIFERFPRAFQGRATHSHRRLIENYKNLWHMGIS